MCVLDRPDWSVSRLQDLQQRIQKHSEVETVDLVLKLKDKLVSMSQRSYGCCRASSLRLLALLGVPETPAGTI